MSVLIQHSAVKVSASPPQAICLGPLCNVIKIRAEKVCLQSADEPVQRSL